MLIKQGDWLLIRTEEGKTLTYKCIKETSEFDGSCFRLMKGNELLYK